MSVATANLVGITGITRRMVLDGVLSEPDARRAMDEAGKAKMQVHAYLLQQHVIVSGEGALAVRRSA